MITLRRMMADTQRLKLRFMAALIPFGIAAGACGGNTDGDGSGGSGGSGTAGSAGEGGNAGTATDSGVAGAAGALACSGFGSAEQECFGRGPSGCPPFEGMQNSCCNPAVAGPIEKGDQCCYVFCAGACCGRAFVVDGAPRLAALTARRDWLAELGDASEELDAVTRRALSAAWLEDARMEHASIASFARFALELVALGAPPDLVAASQRAALDEIEHARACFALGSRLAGEALGPGALEVAGSELRRTLADAAVAAFLEGAVGETIAALTAREQLSAARDPATIRALEMIARDEEAHAELAWRFLGWSVRQGGPEVKRAISAALEDVLRAPQAHAVAGPPPGVNVLHWRQFGRLTAGVRERIARQALRDVIVPCARALVGEREARLPAAV